MHPEFESARTPDNVQLRGGLVFPACLFGRLPRLFPPNKMREVYSAVLDTYVQKIIKHPSSLAINQLLNTPQYI